MTTPLIKAIVSGKTEAALRFIQDEKYITQVDEFGKTPLYLAIEKNQLDIVNALLENGADPNLANRDEETAFFEDRITAVASMFLNPHHVSSRSETPLTLACQTGNTEIVRSLLEPKNHVDVNYLIPETGKTGLILAAQHNHFDVVALLLNKDGINLDIQDRDGETALYRASYHGYLDIVTALLEKGANPNLTDDATPLYVAASHGHPQVVEALLEKGADVRLLLNNKFSAIHVAAGNKHPDIVKVIISFFIPKENHDNYDNLISIINLGVTTNGTMDFPHVRKIIRKTLTDILRERVELKIQSGDIDQIKLEIRGLKNIRDNVLMLKKRDGAKKEKTATRAINAMIVQLKAKRIQLEGNMEASPANAAIALSVFADDDQKIDLARYLLNTHMIPEQRDDLLNTLKELNIKQFDHLKQQLKDFVPVIKREQASLNEQRKLQSLFRENNKDVYNANPFLFILRTGTSEYEQKNTDSFNTARDEIMGSALMNGLKNLTTFALRRAAPKPDSKTVYRVIGDNSL
jgi:ankyrin repeat protein